MRLPSPLCPHPASNTRCNTKARISGAKLSQSDRNPITIFFPHLSLSLTLVLLSSTKFQPNLCRKTLTKLFSFSGSLSLSLSRSTDTSGPGNNLQNTQRRTLVWIETSKLQTLLHGCWEIKSAAKKSSSLNLSLFCVWPWAAARGMEHQVWISHLIALCLALSGSSEGHGAGDGASAMVRAMVRAFIIWERKAGQARTGQGKARHDRAWHGRATGQGRRAGPLRTSTRRRTVANSGECAAGRNQLNPKHGKNGHIAHAYLPHFPPSCPHPLNATHNKRKTTGPGPSLQD